MIGQLYRPSIDTAAGTYSPRHELVADNLAWLWGDSYSHVLSVDGGMLSASFTITEEKTVLNEWLNYLGYNFETLSAHLAGIFQGFVNQITFTYGEMTVVVGPLTEVRNRIAVLYTPIFDATTDPPLQGSQRATTFAQDITSQDRYGLFVDYLSGGTCLDDGITDEADDYRDLAIIESSDPPTTGQAALGGAAMGSIAVEILGYGERLQYEYYEDATTASIAVSDKVIAALASDAYTMFSSTRYIDTNARLVAQDEVNLNTIATVIEDLRRAGDASQNPWFFEIGWDNVPRFYQQPTDIAYQLTLGGIERFPAGMHLEPWEIKPGKWLFMPMLLVGKEQPQPANFRRDPRMEFIESVTVSGSGPPSITGSKYGRLDQFLAQREGTY